MTDLHTTDAQQAPPGAPSSGPTPNDTAVVRSWLQQLYGHATDGWLTTFSIDRTTGERRTDWGQITPGNPALDLAPIIARRAATADIWHGVATRTNRLNDGRRGGDTDCHQIPGLWLDIDIAGPNHKTTEALPTTIDQALELAHDYPVPPTATIHSGGGLQVWWLFPDMIPAADTAPLLARWGATWARLAAARGWHLDNVFDLARIMRVPGTFNQKQTAPVPVRILEGSL